jgi:hypothetical protein
MREKAGKSKKNGSEKKRKTLSKILLNDVCLCLPFLLTGVIFLQAVFNQMLRENNCAIIRIYISNDAEIQTLRDQLLLSLASLLALFG